MDVWETLNGIYEPLWQRTVALNKRLKEAGYSCKWDYCAFHSSIREGEYRMEYFPIPVITAEGICDIGVELDSVFIDAHLSRAQALAFDWAAVPWPFEVYGTENFLEDLLRPDMPPEELRAVIEQSGEEEIGIAFSLPGDCGDEEILEIAAACKKWNTHVI